MNTNITLTADNALAAEGFVLQGLGPTYPKDKINMTACCP